MLAYAEDKTLCQCAPVEKIAEALYRCASTAEPHSDARLDRLIERVLDLDNCEARELDALSGADPASFTRDPESFCAALQQTIRELRLHKLFTRTHEGEFHRGICPAAYNERTGEHHPEEMAQWRSEFRAMTPERQMMAATIVWLYQSGPDSTWLRRVPCTWRVSEALHYMQDAGSLALWLRLIARYPGW